MFWCIEKDLFSEDKHFDLSQFVKETYPNDEVLDIPRFFIYDSLLDESVLKKQANLIVRCSIANIRRFKDVAKYSYFTDFTKFDALNWLPPLRKYALNSDAYFTDLSHIKLTDPKFIRPSSGRKTFSGQVYDKKKLEYERAAMQQSNLNQFEICLVAKPKQIVKEYRCVFINAKYVSSAMYLFNNDIIAAGEEAPKEVIDFATLVFADPFFDNKFEMVIDVCTMADNSIKLVEINSLHTASLYGDSIHLEKIYRTLRGLWK